MPIHKRLRAALNLSKSEWHESKRSSLIMSFTRESIGKLPRAAMAALLGVLSLSACIGTSPEEALRAEQGDAPDGNPEHRPGQPCLVCHGADYSPGGPVFVLAGTIYDKSSDPNSNGLSGAEVSFLDAANHEFTALTNRKGNFMVRVRTDLSAPKQRSKGQLDIPWQPVFPISVGVTSAGGEERAMESQIWREGSCAACHHGSDPDVDHVEKVWYTELAP